MSNREKCISIVNSFSESQLVNIAALLEAARNAVSEAEDETFCMALYKKYLSDPDKGECVDIKTLSGELGVAL